MTACLKVKRTGETEKKEEEDVKRKKKGDNQRKFLDKSHRGLLCHIIKSSSL